MDANTQSQLGTLRRQYLQLVEPLQLRWPAPEVLKAPDVQAWIFKNFFSDHVSSPPPERYQLRVLKLLISKLEGAISDPEEDVRFLLFFLISSSSTPLPFFSRRRFQSQKCITTLYLDILYMYRLYSCTDHISFSTDRKYQTTSCPPSLAC